MKPPWHWLFHLPVAGFFVVAALGKIPDPESFARDIVNYRLVSLDLAWLFALWLPWLELVAGLGLLWKQTRRDAALLLAGLLVFFQVALVSALVRGLDISCGCFGKGTETSVTFALGRNFLLLACLLAGYWLQLRSQSCASTRSQT